MVRWLNIAKGLGIIFIVLGHTYAPYPYYSFFYYFDIAFFFISDQLFNKKQLPIIKFIKKNKKQEFTYKQNETNYTRP